MHLRRLLSKIFNNWRIKLSCLIIATATWYIIGYNVQPKKDPRGSRHWETKNPSETVFPTIEPEHQPNQTEPKKVQK